MKWKYINVPNLYQFSKKETPANASIFKSTLIDFLHIIKLIYVKNYQIIPFIFPIRHD